MLNNSGASVVQFHWTVVIEHYPSESDTCTREGVRGHTHIVYHVGNSRLRCRGFNQ